VRIQQIRKWECGSMTNCCSPGNRLGVAVCIIFFSSRERARKVIADLLSETKVLRSNARGTKRSGLVQISSLLCIGTDEVASRPATSLSQELTAGDSPNSVSPSPSPSSTESSTSTR